MSCDTTPIRAIDNGANALAEGFLFGVAALLIIGETWRSSRSQSKRRDTVNDQLESLQENIQNLNSRIDTISQDFDTRWSEQQLRQVILTVVSRYSTYGAVRNDELTRILERVVEIGLRGGGAEFEDTPLPLPLIQLVPSRPDRTEQEELDQTTQEIEQPSSNNTSS